MGTQFQQLVEYRQRNYSIRKDSTYMVETRKPIERERIVAKIIARYSHEGDVRKVTGEPYFTHSEKVADRVREMLPEDIDVYAMALLHDVLDVPGAQERVGGPDGLRLLLGERAVRWANGVEAMTKDRAISNSEERSAEMLRRCVETGDWRVWMVEIVDKWATVDDLPSEIEEYGYTHVESKFNGGFSQYAAWVRSVRDAIDEAIQSSETLDDATRSTLVEEIKNLTVAYERFVECMNEHAGARGDDITSEHAV